MDVLVVAIFSSSSSISVFLFVAKMMKPATILILIRDLVDSAVHFGHEQ